MKTYRLSLLVAGLFTLAVAVAATAADTSRLVGKWKIDLAGSTSIKPWEKADLDISVEGDAVRIVRHLQWGPDRKVDDTTRVLADGKTVTANPVGYWLDTWYTNVYVGGDKQKQVTGEWLDGGRVLKLESRLTLEAQQGDYPVHVYDEYRLSPDGRKLTLFELRSTRDQALVYVFNRVFTFPDLANAVTTPSGLKYVITHQGTGAAAQPGQVVIAHYTGTLADGTVFDSSHKRNQPFAFTLGRKQVIKGWDEGFAQLRVGDRATLIIPPELAYGSRAVGSIPPDSALKFEVELLDLKARALSDLLQDEIEKSGLEAALKQFADLKAAGFGDCYVSESQLNGLGYRYLQKDKLPEAFAIMKLNVELFPASGNTHDSYGEVLLKQGHKDLALAEYRRSLELDPANENAVKMIAELTKP
jgi:hypothetical protein